MDGAAAEAMANPRIDAVPASKPLSMSNCWINLARPAPIEIRRAISRSRAAARATRRFATLEQAINRTSTTTTARIHNGRSKSIRTMDGVPVAAGLKFSGAFIYLGS